MKVKNDKALARFRTPGRCEICGSYCPRREAHHVRTRGSGGPDHPWNALGICPPEYGNACHYRLHFGGLVFNGRRVRQADLFDLVSAREGVSVATIIAELDRLRGLPNPPRESRRKKPRERDRSAVPCVGCRRPVRTLRARTWPAGAMCQKCRKARAGA